MVNRGKGKGKGHNQRWLMPGTGGPDSIPVLTPEGECHTKGKLRPTGHTHTWHAHMQALLQLTVAWPSRMGNEPVRGSRAVRTLQSSGFVHGTLVGLPVRKALVRKVPNEGLQCTL